MQRSTKPFIISTPCKNKKKIRNKVTEKRKRKRTVTYLSQAEKTRLPHGLSCMIAQVFVIIILDDGRELPDGISRVLAEEGRALLNDETFGRH